MMIVTGGNKLKTKNYFKERFKLLLFSVLFVFIGFHLTPGYCQTSQKINVCK